MFDRGRAGESPDNLVWEEEGKRVERNNFTDYVIFAHRCPPTTDESPS